MKNIKPFTKEQFEDQNNFEQIVKLADEALQYNYLENDKRVMLNIAGISIKEGLQKDGQQIDEQLKKKYSNLAAKIDFINIPTLGEEEIISLFKKSFLTIFKVSLNWGIDMAEKLRAKVFGMPDMEKRDPFLQDIKNAIKQNIEKLGNKSIDINGKPKEPSAKNWIADYERMVGAGEHGELDISNYLFKSKNARILSTEEKNILKEILRLYEKLKLDMTHPNGIATYPLDLFGIKEVGSGLNKRYFPADPEEYKKEIEERKKLREEKKKMVKEGVRADSNLLGVRRDIVRKKEQETKEENVPETKPEPKSDYEIQKEKKFSKLTPISKVTIAKLATAKSLEKLNIEDFKSLGDNASASGAFMASKLKKIAESSPENREAIKYYLRRSALYKTYLEQGKASVDLKKDIGEIAKAREEEGKEYLGKEEFEELRKVLKGI